MCQSDKLAEDDKKKQMSDEKVAYEALGYLYNLSIKKKYDERLSKRATAYRIATKAPAFRSNIQRPQRITKLLMLLEEQKYVKSEIAEGRTDWEITNEGEIFYKNTAIRFMRIFI